VERGVDVLEVGGPPPSRRWRRWRVALLVLAATVLAGLAVHGALSHRHDAGRGVPAPAGPTYRPEPALARAAAGALPSYPGTVPPIGYLKASAPFVGSYADEPGRRVQVDAACAGTGRVELRASAETGQPLGEATALCASAPAPVTITLYAPPGGSYQVVFTPGPATGVLAWRLVPW
jgi:hypothetical protein